MSQSADGASTREGGVALVEHDLIETLHWEVKWACEKWDQDKVDFVMQKMIDRYDRRNIFLRDGIAHVRHNVGGKDLWLPESEGLPSDYLREFGVEPDDITIVSGNLLLNEGIQRLLDLLIAAGGTAFNNANAFIGVGDTSTAEAATQTELLAAAAATNRFYKAMNASYPARPGSNGAQSVDWRSDFTSTEANFVWNEWTIAAGATTASGSGFLTGTTNLNRKVQSLGTKTTGTWTLTGTVTIS